MSRHCARPACGAPAVATLAYDYASRTVWLGPLADAAHPSTHDLCAGHADRLSVPLGWDLDDRRHPAAARADEAPAA